MSECTEVRGDAGSVWPPRIDRLQPNETDTVVNDLTNDADCQGAGVIIIGAIASIHPDDDDGELTLGATVTNGLELTQFLTTLTSTLTRDYLLNFAITLSDTRVLQRQVAVPVEVTRRPWA